MDQIPDAPWIRDAELNGVGETDETPVYCPICGSETDTIYTDRDGDAVGCSECVSMWDAYDWRDGVGQ